MPVEKNMGDTVTINAVIRNTSTIDGYFAIQTNLTGVTTIHRGMDAGQEIGVSFPFVADQAGTFDVTVNVFEGPAPIGRLLDTMTLPGELIVREAPVIAAEIVSVVVT